MPRKFWNVVLERAGRDQVDEWCKNGEVLRRSQGEMEHGAYSKAKEG